MNNYERFIRLVKHKRKYFLFLLVFLNILALIGLFRININSDLSLLKPSDSAAMKGYKNMVSEFGSAEQLIFLVKSSKENPEKILSDFLKLQNKVESINGVEYVNGPVPPAIPEGLGIKKVEEITENNIDRIMSYIQEIDVMKALYNIGNEYYGLFTIFPNADKIQQTSENVLEVFKETGMEFYNSGEIYLQTAIFDYILQIIITIPPIALLLILLIFRWRIGNIKGTFLSILPAGIGALWTMGLLGWSSTELSVITVLTPIFTIVMGSADGLHFISHIQDDIRNGKEKQKALSSTLEKVGWPMILTTFTTAAGFLSLLVIQSEPMRQLAFTASMGVFLAGVATWIFLPAIYIGLNNKQKQKTKPVFDPVTPLLKKTFGKTAVISTIILSVAFIPGFFFIETDLNMLNLYKENTEVRQDIQRITEIAGGAIPIFIKYETNKDPLSPDIATRVLELETKLKEESLVTKSISIYNVFSTLNKIVFHSEREEYPNQARANLMFMMLSSVQKQEISNTILRDEKMGRLIVFPKDLSNKTLEKIKELINKYEDNNITFNAVGMPLVMKEMNDRIIPDQINSILLAVLLVFILMWLTLRNIKMALIGVIPLGTTLISLFGFMGYAGIELSIVTSTIASITIGVGIDYSVHFTSLFKSFSKQSIPNEATSKSFDYVSKPVLANALGLATGLSALLLSPLKFHTYVSMLMWVTMLISSFVSLTFLPTVLSKAFSKKGLHQSKSVDNTNSGPI
ncbi:MAG: efflux RND transporter permease subunit [Petrotogales bacterium]